MAFIPKGKDPNDNLLVSRSPSTTRPISLSNTDSKYFALAINRPLAEVAKITAHPRQRGFVQGRSLIDNVLEVEGFAQSYAIAEAENPAIFLFDLLAAFPSLSHKWLFVVLRKMGSTEDHQGPESSLQGLLCHHRSGRPEVEGDPHA